MRGSVEGELAITRLIRRIPNVDLAGERVWNGRINLRWIDQPPRGGRLGPRDQPLEVLQAGLDLRPPPLSAFDRLLQPIG